MRSVIAAIMKERARQDVKWGIQNHSSLTWLGILTEELGELARAVIEQETWICPDCEASNDFNTTQCSNCEHDGRTDLVLRQFDNTRVKEELIQVAAVAVVWLENIDRSENQFATWVAAHTVSSKGENQ